MRYYIYSICNFLFVCSMMILHIDGATFSPTIMLSSFIITAVIFLPYISFHS